MRDHRPWFIIAALTAGLAACGVDSEPPLAVGPTPETPQLISMPALPPVEVHDGTGDGFPYTAPNDPSPGAPGIWLGNLYSARFCYSDHNANTADGDMDWLDDECEYQLAAAFAPVLSMSATETCRYGEPYWAAKYFDGANGIQEPESVRLFYMPAYYYDCGDEGHPGDSEVIMLAVTENPVTRHWEVRKGFLSAHAGGINDASDWLDTDFEFPTQNLGYPRVYVAFEKHGNYRSRSQCSSRAPLFNDTCADNVSKGRIRVDRTHNVGSRFRDLFPNGVLSVGRGGPELEYFYNWNAPYFRGWNPPAFGNGSTPYYQHLSGKYFETWVKKVLQPNQDLRSYAGPGPFRPATTITTGAIDGPSTVTSLQNSTWNTFVTGGTSPYTTRWDRLFVTNGATWTNVGNTSGTGYSAGGLVYMPVVCTNFTLRATFTSMDGQQFAATRFVTVVCAPSVSLSGPTVISAKGLYTFTATTVGMSNPTFTWSERFCNSSGVAGCGAWSSISGTSTYTRNLNPDCGGDKSARFELQVTAQAGGVSRTASTSTALCNTAPL